MVALSAQGPAAVLTADVITPACDDPFVFGQLAAANALSDVYAMGGTPLAVLNLCFFPEDADCPRDVKVAILRGVHERVTAAGAAVVGGHSVRDVELKVGLAVMGSVDRTRMLTKGGLQPGQVLILSKPLGVGVLINGYRNGACSHAVLLEVLQQQVVLNHHAAAVALAHGATGATDITGFGLVGHALEMAQGAGVTLAFHSARVPVLAAAVEMVGRGITSRGQKDNQQDAAEWLDVEAGVDPVTTALCHDPQTSGGLLFGVAPQRATAVLEALAAQGLAGAAVVGNVRAGPARVHLMT